MAQHSNYYFLKFFEDDVARYWISGENIVRAPAVAVYFGKSESKDIHRRINEEHGLEMEKQNRLWLGSEKEKGGKGRNWDDLKTFFNACEKDRSNTIFVVFVGDDVKFLRPCSEIRDLSEEERRIYHKYAKEEWGRKDDDNPKICLVTEAPESTKRWKLPFVLATSNADQSLNRGTCREYREPNHLNALNYIFSPNRPAEPPKNCEQLLSNLGPVELETLAFLNLHERGLHCPANRGSTIPDVDLIVLRQDESHVPDDLLPVRFEKDEITFQVKLRTETVSEKVNYTIALNGTTGDKRLAACWLLNATYKNARCFKWLKQELYWLNWSDNEWESTVKRLIKKTSAQ